MNAAQALKLARDAGVGVAIDGDNLVLRAAEPPPDSVIGLLSSHKAEVLALLRPAGDGWSAEDWQMFFDERAGIIEFDGGLPRVEAEAQAFACCVVEWLNRNFVAYAAGYCACCRRSDFDHDPLLPHGVEPFGHFWLHSGCWPTWHAGRKNQAVVELAAMGIAAPQNFQTICRTKTHPS